MNDNTSQEILKRLDVLIYLELQRRLSENPSLNKRDLIGTLSNIGLKYAEIAAILGKSPSYVASELTLLKKRRG